MPRILMIDDEPALLMPHLLYLQEKGCEVEVAECAQQALLQLSKHSYQLILLDVKMPKTSGFDLCTELKKLTSAPVIFLSSMTQDSHQVQGFLAGGADYIAKDCSLELFWARVNARLLQSEHGKDFREFPPLILDLQHHQARINGEDIRLTQTEFQMLLLLSSRPGEVWSIDAIYRALWGNSGAVIATPVQMHLSRMRNKIEKAFPQHEFVETVWGKGYRFISRNG